MKDKQKKKKSSKEVKGKAPETGREGNRNWLDPCSLKKTGKTNLVNILSQFLIAPKVLIESVRT